MCRESGLRSGERGCLIRWWLVPDGVELRLIASSLGFGAHDAALPNGTDYFHDLLGDELRVSSTRQFKHLLFLPFTGEPATLGLRCSGKRHNFLFPFTGEPLYCGFVRIIVAIGIFASL